MKGKLLQAAMLTLAVICYLSHDLLPPVNLEGLLNGKDHRTAPLL